MKNLQILSEADWINVRLGKATASRLGDAFAEIKNGYAASRRNYRTELIIERETGMPYPHYISDEMRFGITTEPMARQHYETVCDTELSVTDEGFHFWTPHPTIALAGASPDAIDQQNRGLVEIKCPNSGTHWEYRQGKVIPIRYVYQMAFQLACNPWAEWCDWVSFDPRFVAKRQFLRHRMVRDNAAIAAVENKVREFLDEVQREYDEAV